MSSFFRTGETSSSEYTETESSDEEQMTQQAAKSTRNVRGLVESSDDDDGVRVAKSQKDKIFEMCQALCDRIIKLVKTDEISKASENFKQLALLITKSQAVFARSGFPQSVVKTVTTLAPLLKEVDLSQLDTTNKKAVGELVQQLVKFKNAYQKQFEAAAANKALQAAQQKPRSSLFAGSDDEDEDEDEDEEDDEEEEDELTEELTEEETEEEEAEDDDIDLSKFVGKITREFWLKKTQTGPQKTQAEIAKQEAEDKEKQRLLKQQQRQAAALSAKKDDILDENGQVLTRMEKQRLELLKKRANEKITPEIMQKKLREIVALRGRRSEAQEAISELLFLKDKAQDAATTLRIQTLLALFYFDQNSKPHAAMALQHWRESYNQISQIISILNKDKAVVRLVEDDQFDDSAFSTVEFDQDVEAALQEGSADVNAQKAWYAARNEALQQAKERALNEQAKQRQEAELAQVTFVEGNLYSYLYKLSTEYYTGLQLCDPIANSAEYVNRLREQTRLVALFESAYQYYLEIDKPRMSKRVAELILEYIYYRYVPDQDVLLATNATNAPNAPNAPNATPPPNKVDFWTDIVLSSDEPRSRIKALLFQLYNSAIHNKYEFTKERLASSYLVDTIHDLDIDTRILYNRTLTQMGLAAFRAADYKGAINYLGDLLNRSQRIKELLAQGVSKTSFESGAPAREDELEAKKRVYPVHQHIDLDYLDAVHFVSAMIVEIPSMAEQGTSKRPTMGDQRKIISKPFRRHYSYFLERLSRTNITPSIDSARDAILAAAHEISKGNWPVAVQLLVDDVKVLFRFNRTQASFIQASLTNAIKISAFKSYLFTHSAVYSSISLSTFTAMFQLPEKTITAIINTHAYNEHIHAAWDADSKTPENPTLVISSRVSQSSNPLGAAYVEKLNSLQTILEKIAGRR